MSIGFFKVNRFPLWRRLGFWGCSFWYLPWRDMIYDYEGPWGESRYQGVIVTYFGGVNRVARSEGGGCGVFVSCGRNLHGSKGNYFNNRTLLIAIGNVLQGGGMGCLDAE